MIRQYGVEGTKEQNSPSPGQDFDDRANDLWSLYGKEAESHDKARIETLKDDMDGVLIFVCAHFFWSTGVDVSLSRLAYSPLFSRRSSCHRFRI